MDIPPVVAVYSVREQGWDRRRSLGWAAFVVGTGLALFLEDFLAILGADGTDLFWIEMSGLAMMADGLLVYSRAKTRNANPA